MAGTFEIIHLTTASMDGLIAQATETSLLSTLVSQVWLWTRVAIGIGFVVFVHELGHFLAAKWCGVKVEKFYVGFDVPIKIGPIQFPRTLGRFRWGETEYGLGTIPLGGYVKMLGQDDDPRKAEAEAKRIRMSQGDDPTDDAGSVTLDPRSFPAKPVWQRMIIISSGVVMNLITGVMFAMAAFWIGVPYTPAVIGDVTPGGPAYQAGIQPGGKVLSVGTLPRDEKLHFRDMRIAILTEGMKNPDQPVPISIEYADGVRDYVLQTASMAEDPAQRIIGILTPSSVTLSETLVASPGSVAAGVLSEKDAGAQIIAVDDTPLPGDGSGDNPEASIALRKHLQANVAKPVSLTLKRVDGSETKVVLPPQPLKLPGVRFAIGPVTALVKDGAAMKAGVQVGDRLIAVNGDRKIDAFALPSQLADTTEPTKMTFLRQTDQSESEIELTLVPSTNRLSGSPISETSNVFALDGFDFAFEALAQVASVEQAAVASGSSEVPSNLLPGDSIRSIAVMWNEDSIPEILKESRFEELRQKLTTGWEVNNQYPLSALVSSLQLVPEGTRLKFIAERAGNIVETESQMVQTDVPTIDRGLGLTPVERIHTASSLSESFALGLRESGRRLTDVFSFLQMLVQGKVQAKQVGGPIRIFSVAGSETSRGISPLLMFLTMLSMNLAILNFLPIPALDGGHMLFLTAEAVLGRPVDEKLQMQLTMAGVLALLSLMVFAVYNDIRHL